MASNASDDGSCGAGRDAVSPPVDPFAQRAPGWAGEGEAACPRDTARQRVRRMSVSMKPARPASARMSLVSFCPSDTSTPPRPPAHTMVAGVSPRRGRGENPSGGLAGQAHQLDDAGLAQRMRRCFLLVCSHGSAVHSMEIHEHQWWYMVYHSGLLGGPGGGGASTYLSKYFFENIWESCRTTWGTMRFGGFIDAVAKIGGGNAPPIRDGAVGPAGRGDGGDGFISIGSGNLNMSMTLRGTTSGDVGGFRHLARGGDRGGEAVGFYGKNSAATATATAEERAAAAKRRYIQHVQGVWDAFLAPFVTASTSPQSVTLQTLDPLRNGWSIRSNAIVAMAVKAFLPGFRRLMWLFGGERAEGEMSTREWSTLCEDLCITPSLLTPAEADEAFTCCADKGVRALTLDSMIHALLVCGLRAYSKLANDGHKFITPQSKIVELLTYLAQRVDVEFDEDVPGSERLPVPDTARPRQVPIPIRLSPKSGNVADTVTMEMCGMNFFCTPSSSKRLQALTASPTAAGRRDSKVLDFSARNESDPGALSAAAMDATTITRNALRPDNFYVVMIPTDAEVDGEGRPDPTAAGVMVCRGEPTAFNKVEVAIPKYTEEDVAQMCIWTSLQEDTSARCAYVDGARVLPIVISLVRLRVYHIEASHDSMVYSRDSDLLYTYEDTAQDSVLGLEVVTQLREVYQRYATAAAAVGEVVSTNPSPPAGAAVVRSTGGLRDAGRPRLRSFGNRRGSMGRRGSSASSRRGSTFITQGSPAASPCGETRGSARHNPRASRPGVVFCDDTSSAGGGGGRTSPEPTAAPATFLDEDGWNRFCVDHYLTAAPKIARGLPIHSTVFDAAKRPRESLTRESITHVVRDERGASTVCTDGELHDVDEGDAVTFTGFVLMLVWMFSSRSVRPPTAQQFLNVLQKPKVQQQVRARLEQYDKHNLQVSKPAARDSGIVCARNHALDFAQLTERGMVGQGGGEVRCGVCQSPFAFGDVVGVCPQAACRGWASCAPCAARRSNVSVGAISAMACRSGITEAFTLHNGTAGALNFPPPPPAPAEPAQDTTATSTLKKRNRRKSSVINPTPPCKPAKDSARPPWKGSKNGFGQQVLQGCHDVTNSVVITNYPKAWATQRDIDALLETYNPARTSIGNSAVDDVTVSVYVFWKKGEEAYAEACVKGLHEQEVHHHVLQVSASPSLFVALGARRPLTAVKRRPSHLIPNPAAPRGGAQATPTARRAELLRQNLSKPVERRLSAASTRATPFSKSLAGDLMHVPQNWISLPIVIEAQWERNPRTGE